MSATTQAMDRIFNQLDRGDIRGAQNTVLEVERPRHKPGPWGDAALPSSMFERVLVRALAANALEPAYSDFCLACYGKTAYAAIVAQNAPKAPQTDRSGT